MATLYCSFAKNTGWRIVGCERYFTDRKIRVALFNGKRCLSIPVILQKRGLQCWLFCNPTKLAFYTSKAYYVESTLAQTSFCLRLTR